MNKKFFDLYGNKTINEIFYDQEPVSIYSKDLIWINVPDDDFINYVINRIKLPFDGVPKDDSIYKRDPTFMIAQMHRFWITIKVMSKYILNESNFTVLDLGAFPFSLDLIIREYLELNVNIFASTNWEINENWKSILEEENIFLSFANLDPLIKDPLDSRSYDDTLEFKNNSFNFVILAHVIEHLYHPMYILKEIWRVLKEEGKLFISTDNPFMINTLINLCSLNDFLHEPVENTAAMSSHNWRGHCRFFSKQDLKKMLEIVGFKVIEINFYEILYNSFSDEFFKYPIVELPKWKTDILTSIPDFRNEIIMVAEK